jgi:hypothetical protein
VADPADRQGGCLLNPVGGDRDVNFLGRGIAGI